MPQYEYEAVEDGHLLTLLRPMSAADEPVEDPEGKGRTFRRRHSVFGVATGGGTTQPGPCACGLAPGSCGGG